APADRILVGSTLPCVGGGWRVAGWYGGYRAVPAARVSHATVSGRTPRKTGTRNSLHPRFQMGYSPTLFVHFRNGRRFFAQPERLSPPTADVPRRGGHGDRIPLYQRGERRELADEPRADVVLRVSLRTNDHGH